MREILESIADSLKRIADSMEATADDTPDSPHIETLHGFTRWEGSINAMPPVHVSQTVTIIKRDGSSEMGTANMFRWNHFNTGNDIIAYKVIS